MRWAVMASIIAAETSAATYLGAPTEGFKRQSLAYALLTFGVILGQMGRGKLVPESRSTGSTCTPFTTTLRSASAP